MGNSGTERPRKEPKDTQLEREGVWHLRPCSLDLRAVLVKRGQGPCLRPRRRVRSLWLGLEVQYLRVGWAGAWLPGWTHFHHGTAGDASCEGLPDWAAFVVVHVWRVLSSWCLDVTQKMSLDERMREGGREESAGDHEGDRAPHAQGVSPSRCVFLFVSFTVGCCWFCPESRHLLCFSACRLSQHRGSRC